MFLRIKVFYRQQRRDKDKQRDENAAQPEADIFLDRSQRMSESGTAGYTLVQQTLSSD